MKAALLIGNGLNRCYEDPNSPIAWSNLLKSFAKQYEVDFYEKKSFPLEFECLVNDICQRKGLSSIDVVNVAKDKIVETVNALSVPEDSLHCRFMELGIDEILTTNYDYCLENAYDPHAAIIVGREDKFSLRRCNEIKGKRFRHIHGEADKTKTICLGYEHYAGTVQNMRAYVKSSHFEEKFAHDASFDPLTLTGDSWIDLMFTHDVYIVGLDLDMCEIDLWWMLTYRAYLYYISELSRNKITNTITFYDTTRRADPEYQKSLFERMHVNYVYVGPANEHPVNKDFEDAYRNVAQKIREDLDRKNAAANAAVQAPV